MEEERLGDLKRRAQEATANTLREVAGQETKEVEEAREERWELSTELAKLMKAAYTLYPTAAFISRHRGEAYWRMGSSRGGASSTSIKGDPTQNSHRSLRGREGGDREGQRANSLWVFQETREGEREYRGGASHNEQERSGIARKLSSGKAKKRRSMEDQEVSHWRGPMRVGPINPDSCGAIALALVWCPLSMCSFPSGLIWKGELDKGQIDTRALL